MHNVWQSIVADMARKAYMTQNKDAMMIWNNAFSTSYPLSDGGALVGNHTLIGTGTTYSNLITGALTNTTLNNAMVALVTQPDQAGVVIGCKPVALLVPPKLWKHAQQITKSALEADSAANNYNVFRAELGFEVWTSPYLGALYGGYDTMWFLLGNNHSVTRVIRQGLITDLRDWSVSDNRTYFYQANYREMVFAKDYCGVIGSTGA